MSARRVAVLVGLAALAALLILLLWPTHHHHVRGDVDHPRDCWAHPDRAGRRHCQS